jgi:5-methylthioadenosine/S-adenosylhomocysteine deaminase
MRAEDPATQPARPTDRDDQAGRMVLRGGLLADLSQRTLRRADVVVQAGRIEAIAEPGVCLGSGDSVIDVDGQLLLPGFTNAHTHSYATLSRHVSAGKPLEPWMVHAWANTVGRSADEVRLAALIQAIEGARTGTTTVLDHLGGSVDTVSAALEAYQQVGVKVQLAPMISDIPLPETVGVPPQAWPPTTEATAPEFAASSAHDLLEGVRELHRVWHGRDGRIAVMLGPSAPQRCTNDLLEGCAALSEELDLPVHTHLLESRAQARMTPPAGARSWTEHLRRAGLLTPRLSLAHVVWAAPHELDLIAEAGATIVHNPQSNLQLGSGIGQMYEWRARNIPVALGSDGANCGSLDMLWVIRLAAILHRSGIADCASWEDPWSALEMATSVGARGLGLTDTGQLAKGSAADITAFALDTSPYASGEDALASLVLSSYDHRANLVLIDGQAVVRDGKCTKVDEEAALVEARERHTHLMRRNWRLGQLAEKQTAFLTRVAAQAEPPRPLVEFKASQPKHS